jgi:hypothetical protein
LRHNRHLTVEGLIKPLIVSVALYNSFKSGLTVEPTP